MSFSRAADKLRRSQPGLSRSVKELESELGLQLFERVGRHISLTPQGKELLAQATLLLADADKLLQHARLLATGQRLILRIGGASNTLERIMPDVLPLYRAKWRNVDVRLTTVGGSVLMAAVETGELDLAIGRMTTSELLGSRYAFPTHVIAVVPRSHRMVSRKSVGIADLASERLLVPPTAFSSRVLLDMAFEAEAQRANISLESHDLNMLVALAEAGEGVGIAPSTVDIERRSVRALPIFHGGQPLGSANGLMWNRRLPLARHVLGFVDVAAARLRKNYPGKELRLPPLRPVTAHSAG